ncbi:MAG: hypothetical protein MJY45_02545 [Bacteroidales bacterium]|nr:hypothetical protein [Bacteroidales bacterium]
MKKSLAITLAIAAAAILSVCTSCKGKPDFYFNPSEMTVKVGETKSFEISAENIDVDHDKLKYGIEEGGGDYIRLNGTNVTGVQVGEAKLVAVIEGTSYTATCKIHVTK